MQVCSCKFLATILDEYKNRLCCNLCLKNVNIIINKKCYFLPSLLPFFYFLCYISDKTPPQQQKYSLVSCIWFCLGQLKVNECIYQTVSINSSLISTKCLIATKTTNNIQQKKKENNKTTTKDNKNKE